MPSTASTAVFGFTFNTAGQMTRRDEPDGTYWIYQYDSLGQVTSGKKYWSDNSIVAGQQFEYASTTSATATAAPRAAMPAA